MDQTSALLDEAARIARSDHRGHVLEILARALRRVGIDEFIYGIEHAPGTAPVQIATLQGAADIGLSTHDPFFAHCCRDFRPTLTGAAFLPDYPYLTEADRTVIEQAAGHGMRGGVALATRLRSRTATARGGFNLGGDLGREAVIRHVLPHIPALRQLCLVTDAAFTRLLPAMAGPAPTRPDAVLTAREREVLAVMARGVSRAACGKILGCSGTTVASHLKSAYSKLGTTSLVATLAVLNDRPGSTP